jgi:hypothetical protein
MPAAMYTRGLQKLQDGTINAETDTLKAVLLDMTAYGLQVTAATNAAPIQLTTGTHGLTTNDRVMVGGVGGNTNANGIWQVTVVNATAFTLQGSTGNAAYTSGGYVVKLDADQFLSDIPSAARSGLSAALASKTWTPGATGVIFDSADTTFTAVPAFASAQPARAFAILEDTGTATTSGLIMISDRKADGTAFSVTPNGGDVNLQTTDATNGLWRAYVPVGASA